MSMLKEVIDTIVEDAVGGSTGAGGIASHMGSLFAGGYMNRRKSPNSPKNYAKKPKQLFSEAAEDSDEYNISNVLSKLDAAEKRANADDDVAIFGLEDDMGNVIKVYVKKEHASAFENELGEILQASKDSEEPFEVAEVMYELSKKYDIVDADWGESIVADEEQEQAVAPAAGAAGAAAAAPGAEGDPAAAGAEGAEGTGEEGEGEPDMSAAGGEDMGVTGGEEDAKTALQQVIDMMKADAEAKHAEADARKAEARAREAEAAMKSSEHKVKQEEDILDMEEFNNSKKEEQEEASRLAKLAKYRHDKARDAEHILHSEGYKVPTKDRRTLWTIAELAEVIFENLKAQEKRAKKS